MSPGPPLARAGRTEPGLRSSRIKELPLSIEGRRCITHAYRVLDSSLRPLRELRSEDYRAKTAALDLAVALAQRTGRTHHVVNVETRFTWHVSSAGGIVAVGLIHAEADPPPDPGAQT